MFDEIRIATLSELRRAEPQILERIAATRGGGNLFMAHPLECARHLGVVLSDAARDEWIAAEPALGTASKQAFDALLANLDVQQQIQFTIRGIFAK